MSSPFEKLKLPQSARRTIASLIVGGAGLAARAIGATVNLPVYSVTVGTIRYQTIAANSATISLGGGVKIEGLYGIQEVGYNKGGGIRTDAFDGAAGIAVNRLPFNPPTGQVDLTTTSAGTFIKTITPQNFSGVDASLHYFMSTSSRTLRSVGVFTNNTGTAQTIAVAFGGNLGSDSGTQILATSSGDQVLQVALDRFVISNDSDVTESDPTLTWTFFGPGGKTADTGQYADGNGLIGEEWTLTLAPGQTQELMWFTQFNDDLAEAQSLLSLVANVGALEAAGLLSGLSAEDLAAIQNWSFSSSSGSTLQNSSPGNLPTTADFIVNGPVSTGGGNNTVNTLTFTPGSKLTVYNTLNVTTGPVEIVDTSTLALEQATLKVSQLNIAAGGLLNGNGSIAGNLFNAGEVSPGNSPGKIRVTGNYTQTAAGTLLIQFAGQSKGKFDVLAVDGAAKLNGTLRLEALDKFKLRRGDNFKFLTAGGGVSGGFSQVENPFVTDTILNPALVYSGSSVSLQVRTFEDFANDWNLTTNQKSVARGLDSINYDKRGEELTSFVDKRALNNLPGDFDKIAPEELTSIFTIGTALANVQSLNIQRRNDDIRSGSGGFSAQGLAVNGTKPSYSGSMDFHPGVAGPGGQDGKVMKNVVPEDPRWGAFLSGTGEWVSVGNTDNARGYDLQSGGFTLGLDYKVGQNFAVGVMAGYTGTTADLTNRGRVWVNGGKLGVYATTFVGGWYADAAITGGYNSYDTRRSGLKGQARGSTEGGEVNGLFGTGYDFKAGNLTVGPTATFNYSNVSTAGFTEHGSKAPLSIRGGTGESLRSALGLKASYDWKIAGLLIKPEIRAAWQHEYGDAIYSLDATFASGAGKTFLVNGPRVGRDSALLGAGFAVVLSERASTYLYYDGELGRRNYQSTNVTGGVRIAF